MGENKLANDASDSIGAIIYQFYIALNKCFELEPNETVFIEKFGDVSNSTQQIEVKQYSDPLTDSHLNFWNTVNNWLHVDFDHTRFKNLILLTTQDYGPKTQFAKWNDANSDERLMILNEIKDAAVKRHQTALAKDEGRQKAKPEALALMEKVLSSESAERLNQIVAKTFIADATPLPPEYYAAIKNKYLKGIPSINKDVVMTAMLGLIMSPEITDNAFEITEETFSKQFQEITAQYNSTTIIFPKKLLNTKIDESERNKHLDENYVKKILEIEYDEAIPDAVTHYVVTNKTIAEELMDRLSNKQVYEAYHQEIINQIKPKYATACRNAKEDSLINQSKDHYDSIMSLPSPALGNFNDTHIIFKNGTIHILANDDTYGLRWKLKLEK
ncbi:MAG: hypothetical protein JWP94_946 [Mucilaginibacter sp.]|nr:hypothetical protein [Mucilaginibacter sp.]